MKMINTLIKFLYCWSGSDLFPTGSFNSGQIRRDLASTGSYYIRHCVPVSYYIVHRMSI